MIKVTDKAAKKLKELRESENYSSDHNVRVKVKSGGCSGLQYDLNFDNIISDKDDYFEDNGLKIIVDKKSLFYLLGTELDFSDGLNGKGFNSITLTQIEHVDVERVSLYKSICSAFNPITIIHKSSVCNFISSKSWVFSSKIPVT